jgi:soluble lytic murein transglycosylase-like protein
MVRVDMHIIAARTAALACLSVGLAAAVVLADGHPADAYVVRGGDTLWGLSKRSGMSVQEIAARNHISNPDRIYAGQNLDLNPPAPPPPPARPAAQAAPPNPLTPQQARAILVAAARQQRVDPSLVLALAYWESGWNPAEVSSAGAVGMMQVTPGTAAWAGPALLHRRVDIHSPQDNAAVGAALLRHYLDQFHDEHLALAAYYQGATAVQKHGIYPSSQRYVTGILALRDRARAGAL